MPRPQFDYPTLLKDILTISPILLRNISKMLRNKSFDLREKCGAIYSSSRISRLTIGFGLRIGKHWNYLSRKFEVVARFNSGKYIF